MITGIHALLYTRDAEATRAFLRDVVGFSSVDAGHGWLIFALPPAELGVHPTDGDDERAELYLMCDDVDATVAELRARGVEIVRPVADQGWGRVTAIRIPGGGQLGLYQPRHPTALAIAVDQAVAQSKARHG
jgi:predicted enzyme related to lactoylglutathione lyase